MNTQDTPSTSHKRFIANLAESQLFQQYQCAFHTLTGLALSLDVCTTISEITTTQDVRGVMNTLVPVRVGKTTVAALHAGGVRLAPATAETFAPVARELLEQDRSAADLHEARSQFDALPVMAADRYQAAVALLGSFALQMGESAHRLLFANATHEPETIRKAKQFIHSNLAQPLPLEAVAKAVSVSPFHFCKIFKQATGLTFTDFVNRARVEKAKRLLMKPAARITEVAYDSGFQSLSHFNRSFRRVAAESPTEFRSRMRASQPVSARQAFAAA